MILAKPSWNSVRKAVDQCVRTHCPKRSGQVLSIASRIYATMIPCDYWKITFNPETKGIDINYE
jgi:hypothetical protein